MLDRSLQAQLGRQLRAIFSDVAQEPVPDRFVKLLEALEAREKPAVNSDSVPLKQALLGLIPNLRAFAVSLCGDMERADDLVQETLFKALEPSG